MRKIIIIALFVLGVAAYASAAPDLSQRLSGRILIQVQSRGEAWYVNPPDLKRYYLGRPQDAFELMRKLGLGVTHETAVNYQNYLTNIKGRIIIDTEDLGKAYYINPLDNKSYYLGRPQDAFELMRKLGLGITNENLNKITIGYLQLQNNNTNNTTNNNEEIIYQAAAAIRAGDTQKTLTYFTPKMSKAIEYTMNFLNSEGKLALGNILSDAKLTGSSDTEKIYSTEVYFSLGGYKVPVKFYVKKQPDGKWLMTNL